MPRRTTAPAANPYPEGWEALSPLGTAGAVNVITQHLLAQYKSLCGLESHRKQLRQLLLSMVLAEMPVEPGPYTCRTSSQEQRRLTLGSLAGVVGDAETQHIKSQLSLSTVTFLHVRVAAGYAPWTVALD